MDVRSCQFNDTPPAEVVTAAKLLIELIQHRKEMIKERDIKGFAFFFVSLSRPSIEPSQSDRARHLSAHFHDLIAVGPRHL
jgi:hypothetical protein